MPVYTSDPDNSEKKIDVIELQKRDPYNPLPPDAVRELLKRDSWTRRDALLILAGYHPRNTVDSAGHPIGTIGAGVVFLDGTNQAMLDQAGLQHPRYPQMLHDFLMLAEYANGADEEKSPREWLAWAKGKNFKPYWLQYCREWQARQAGKWDERGEWCYWSNAAYALAHRQTIESEEQAKKILKKQGYYLFDSGQSYPFPAPELTPEALERFPTLNKDEHRDGGALMKLQRHREVTYGAILEKLDDAGKIAYYEPATMLRIGKGEAADPKVFMDELGKQIKLHDALLEKPPGETQPELKAEPEPTEDDAAQENNELAALFDPVGLPELEKMFPAGGKWKSWGAKAREKGLDVAREGRAQYNPYKAGVWWLRKKKPDGWDIGRLERTLANRLPERSRDSKRLLTGDIE